MAFKRSGVRSPLTPPVFCFAKNSLLAQAHLDVEPSHRGDKLQSSNYKLQTTKFKVQSSNNIRIAFCAVLFFVRKLALIVKR